MAVGAMDDSAYSFNRIAGFAVDRNGRLYVADGGDSRIRVYTRAGQFLRDIGRPGAGPGEFLGIRSLGMVGDTCYAIDYQADRVTFFDSAGTLSGSRRAAHGSFTQGSTVTMPFRLLPGGRELSTPMSRTDSDGRFTVLLTRGGEVIDTLVNAPGAGDLRFDRSEGRLFVSNPFAKPMFFPVSDNGEYAAWIESTPFEGMRPGEFEVRLGRLDGSVIWERRFRTEPVAYEQAMADSLINAQLRVMPAGLLTAREFREAASPPEFEWPVQAAFLGDDGRLFVRTPDAAGGGQWLIIGRSGDPVGRFTLPNTASHLRAKGDTLWVSEADEWDVPMIVEYHVQRAPKQKPGAR